MPRENRYLVLKRKELDLLSDEAKRELENIVFALGVAKSKGFDTPAAGEITCVVVEHDWPMYETVWRMIEDWSNKQTRSKMPDNTVAVRNAVTGERKVKTGLEPKKSALELSGPVPQHAIDAYEHTIDLLLKQRKEIKELKTKLSARALKVASRIPIDFLNYEETDNADENYTLLMNALSKQKIELGQLRKERTIALQAIRYYAEQAKYARSWLTGDELHVMEDKGRVAKNALEQFKVSKSFCTRDD